MADKIYQRFDDLRERKGVSVYAVSKATGITTTTFTNWKNGKYTPKREKMELIADYFGVSVDYIMTGKENPFSIEMAAIDVELTNMPLELKEYALKLSKLPQEKQKQIMSLIDMLEG